MVQRTVSSDGRLSKWLVKQLELNVELGKEEGVARILYHTTVIVPGELSACVFTPSACFQPASPKS